MKRTMSAQSLERAASAVLRNPKIDGAWSYDERTHSHVFGLRAFIDGQYTYYQSTVTDIVMGQYGVTVKEEVERQAIELFSRTIAEHLRSKFEKSLEGESDVSY